MQNLKILAVLTAVIAYGCTNSTNTDKDVNQTSDTGQVDTNVKQDMGQPSDTKIADTAVKTDTSVDTGVCKPDCWYKECGDNGCGGSCGTCGNGTRCENHKCVASECEMNDFQAVKSGATWKAVSGSDSPKGYFQYYEISSDKYPLNQLLVRIHQESPFNGPTGPITFKVGGDFILQDTVQVIGLENCPAAGKDCAHYYYGSDGTIEIKKLNGANGPFNAVLHNVKLREITANSSTGKWSYVDGGRKWCLDGHEFKTDTVEGLPKDTCIAKGTGRGFYDNIGDFTLTNCLGDGVNLHSLCGHSKVMWITVVAEWCPHCRENLPIFWKYYTEHKDQVDYWIYVAEGAYGKDPTPANCLSYAEARGIDPSHMFVGDHKWSAIFNHLDPGGSQIGYPFSFLLMGKNMSYVWSSASGGDPTAEISRLLKSN